MYCPECGKKIPDIAVFCGYCGKRIEGEEKPEMAKQKVPEPKPQNGNKSPVIPAIFLVAAILIAIFALAGRQSVGKLEGKYYSTATLSQSFTFEDDEVIIEDLGFKTKGTYKLSGGKIKIKYYLYGLEYNVEYSFKRGNNDKSIMIDGLEYHKW